MKKWTEQTGWNDGGRPGRPISAWAMGERLRKLGIRLAQARSTALFQFAAELPAAGLARTLGIDITVAVKWQRTAAGDWATYAAEISRRTTSRAVHPSGNASLGHGHRQEQSLLRPSITDGVE
ncbi:hypothetical protein [Streptomyces sp. NPDC101776]|uniref:hypothetical protein n=1 Tax=Streptomyces sp. NPDC101776 TaxID=3366146 RepID=UPI00382636FF